METKHVICATCDMACQMKGEIDGGGSVKIVADENHPIAPGAICLKAKKALDIYDHPDRIIQPLKRVGKRGENRWETIGWDQAMDEIADRLQSVVAQYGPESLVVANSPANTSVDSGSMRRFMNLLGSPNWISGVALCLGNTAAVNRITYGWFPSPDYENTNCIVLLGHNPSGHSWVAEYIRIKKAKARGARLIVLDPRESHCARLADMHLRLNVGTDTAMLMGWVNIIIEDELYDKDFVEKWTYGFDKLKERVGTFTLAHTAEVTGVEPDLIREAAYAYAKSQGGIIPWSPITDQLVSSTSAIRLQAILRAITGNINAPGGERFFGFNEDIVSETELELHEKLGDEQKKKQLGCEKYPLFTYTVADLMKEKTEEIYGRPYANIMKGACMANPSETFRAMAEERPYPAKAFISTGNNTLMSYANQQLVYQAIMNQDLVVVHDIFMSPTAQLADYVLPGDCWLERPQLFDTLEWTAVRMNSQQLREPPGECRSIYDLWHDLAVRMGFAEQFPWKNLTDLYNQRIEKTGMDWDTFSATFPLYISGINFRNYEEVGFATPTGKVELYSTLLEKLGFDPLPYYRESPATSESFPLRLFVGVREPHFFQSGQRQVESLRRLNREPHTFVSASTAEKCGLKDGDLAKIETCNGEIQMKVKIRGDMPDDVVRVPHGWWLPEDKSSLLSGAFKHSDSVLVPDSEEYLDKEQGIPLLRGIPCRIGLSSAG
ncbi:MAG: molybdopterin-dependent oxidoreductase [Proteobacteria bacterium]|nr:molybdopterin-dependent oxidoreductase [Pseudomonadota bacterium]